MSCAVDALIEKQMLILGQNTYGIVQRLVEDYQHTLAQFRERGDSALCEQQTIAEQQARDEALAAALAAHTRVTPAEDATAIFMQQQIARLEQRLASLSAPTPDLIAQCQALQHEMLESPDALERHLDLYRRLAEEVASAQALQGHSNLSAMLADEIDALRTELESPLLASQTFSETRQQMQAQLDSLQQVGVRQPQIAAQGLAMIRQRIHREMKAEAERRQQQTREATETRALIAEMLAKLQAILRQPDLAAFAEQATGLLDEIRDSLARPDGGDLQTLRSFAERADTLFVMCARTLEGEETAKFISEQVTEILSGMGYQVSQLPGEGSATRQDLLTAVDGDVGLHVAIDGQGHLGMHMVALDEEARGNGAEAQERVCSLVDAIFGALRERECGVRERFRTSLAPGEELPVLEVPKDETEERTTTAAPQYMRMDQP